MRSILVLSILTAAALAECNSPKEACSLDALKSMGINPGSGNGHLLNQKEHGAPFSLDVGAACWLGAQKQSDGDDTNASAKCPTWRAGGLVPLAAHERLNIDGGKVVFKYPSAGEQTLWVNTRICTGLQPGGFANWLGVNEPICAWPYGPRDGEVGYIGVSVEHANDTWTDFVGIVSTVWGNEGYDAILWDKNYRNKPDQIRLYYPFSVESAWVRKGGEFEQIFTAKNGQRELKSYANINGQNSNLPDFDYSYTVKANYPVKYSNESKKPELSFGFKPLKCKEDVVYKITRPETLSIYGKRSRSESDLDSKSFTLAYSNPLEHYECKYSQYPLKNGISIGTLPVNQRDVVGKMSGKYYHSGGYNCDPSAREFGGMCYDTNEVCTSDWSAYKTYDFKDNNLNNNHIFVSNPANKDLYILVQGDSNANSCAPRMKLNSNIFTLSNPDGSAKINSFSNITSLPAHAGVLTRVANAGAAYRFDISNAQDAAYLIIEPNASNLNVFMNDGKQPKWMNRETCYEGSMSDYCRLKNSLKFSDNAQVIAVRNLAGGGSYLCKNMNDTAYCNGGENLRFYITTSHLEPNLNPTIYLANTDFASVKIEHAPFSARAEQFNFDNDAHALQLRSLFSLQDGLVYTASGFSGKITDAQSAYPDGSYRLGRALYQIITEDGREYEFYDSAKDLGRQNLNASTTSAFGKHIGFFAVPKQLYYAVEDYTLERYLREELKLNANDYCRTQREFDPKKANYVDAEGKITCSVPGRAKLEFSAINAAPKVGFNYDSAGALNVIAANSKLSRLQLIYMLKAFSLQDAAAADKKCFSTSGELISMQTDANRFSECVMLEGNWADISSGPIELGAADDIGLALSFNNLPANVEAKRVICKENSGALTCSLDSLPSQLALAKSQINSDFVARINEVCAQTYCKGPGISPDASKPLMQDLIQQQKNLDVKLFSSSRGYEQNASISLNALAQNAGNNESSVDVNFFSSKKIQEFQTSLYGVNLPVLEPTLIFMDQKSNLPNTTVVPGTQKLTYQNAAGKGAEFILQDSECPIYDGTNACYNSQIAGPVGFENNYRRPRMLSQYNNKIEYLPTPEYKITRKNADKSTYEKDIINCLDGVFSCADFSVEFTR